MPLLDKTVEYEGKKHRENVGTIFYRSNLEESGVTKFTNQS